jgi:hypothetical protein
MSRACSVIVFLSMITAFRSLHADLPMGPPEDYEARSPNGQYVARMTVTPPRTAIYALRNGVGVEEWSMEGFHRKVYLADDGQHLVIGYVDLILRPKYSSKESPDLAAKNGRDSIHAWGPANYSPDMVMLQFVERGRIVREITLHELMPDLSKMIRTASSWHWGDFWPGLSDRGEFLVQTADYRELHFDVKTGRLARTGRMYRSWLRDLMWPPYRNAVPSLAVGIIIGTFLRGRVRLALVTSIAISVALLVVALWIQGSFASLGDEFTTVGYNFIATLVVLYLVPSTLAVMVLSFLWRIAARLMKES